jgi:hypothetical protein
LFAVLLNMAPTKILAGDLGHTPGIYPLPAEMVAVVVGTIEAAGHKLVCGGVCKG